MSYKRPGLYVFDVGARPNKVPVYAGGSSNGPNKPEDVTTSVTATHDGNGNVVLHGITIINDGNGNVKVS